MQQFLLYKAHCSDERGEEGGGQHSCLEGKQFKQFTTYFTVKERKGGNLLSDGRRRRNGNGSISGARPCIDIAPPLQLLDLDPPRARSGISPLIRRNGAFSLGEEGMEEGVKSAAAAAYSVSPSLLSSPFSSRQPTIPEVGQQRLFTGWERRRRRRRRESGQFPRCSRVVWHPANEK